MILTYYFWAFQVPDSPLLRYSSWFNHPNSIKPAVVPTWSNKMYTASGEYTQPANSVSCYSKVCDGFAFKLTVLLDSYDRKSANSFDRNFSFRGPPFLSLSRGNDKKFWTEILQGVIPLL